MAKLLFSLDYLTDPEVFAAGALLPHSDHAFYSAGGKGYFSLPLSGEWGFELFDSSECVDMAFLAAEHYDAMERIEIPSNIELLGKKPPVYCNISYPWDGREALRPPKLPKYDNYTSCFAKKFSLPRIADGERLRVRFDGVSPCVFAWLNGQFLGYREDSCTPSEFDVTEYAREGENLLCAMTPRFCTGSWLEDQDFWRLTGIFRPVTVYAVPAAHIEHLSAIPAVSESLDSASLKIEATLSGDASAAAFARASLADSRGAVVAWLDTPCTLGKLSCALEVENPRLWSAETPELYALTLTLFSGDGALLESAVTNVGMRRFELKDGVMLLNGKRIVFHGVNRHEFHAERGRAINASDILFDLKAIKQNGFNAVRTSHYPDRSEFYELCDRLGLYVIDEMNLETHGTWQKGRSVKVTRDTLPGDRREWREAVFARAKAMAARDINHPSILMWSCGNESAGGTTLRDTANYFRSLNDGRLVHYEGTFNDPRCPETSDVESRMYATVESIRAYLDASPKKPFICCEYAHAMGNSFGNVDEYYALEDEYNMYQGGFVWDYLDLGILVRDEGGKCHYAVGGDFGDRPNDSYFCGDGLMLSDKTPSPKMAEARFLNRMIRIGCRADGFVIENRYSFISTDGFIFRYELRDDGVAVSRGEFTVCVPAGENAFVPCGINVSLCRGEAVLACYAFTTSSTDWADAGHEVSYGEAILKQAVFKKPDGSKLLPTVGDFNAGARMDSSFALFEGSTGFLTSLAKNGLERITYGLRPDFWRAPTDNDIPNGNTARWSAWKANSLYMRCKNVVPDIIKLGITAEFDLPQFDGKCSVTYSFYKCDTVRAIVKLSPFNGDLPCFGLTFAMPKEFDRIEYYGNANGESCCDRRAARRLAQRTASVSSLLTPYLHPQECGNITDIRTLKIVNADGRGLLIRSDGEFEASVLPYTSHELECAHNIACLPPVTRTVVSLRKAMCGVGGDDSWGAKVHDKYLVRGDKGLSFTVYISVI